MLWRAVQVLRREGLRFDRRRQSARVAQRQPFEDKRAHLWRPHVNQRHGVLRVLTTTSRSVPQCLNEPNWRPRVIVLIRFLQVDAVLKTVSTERILQPLQEYSTHAVISLIHLLTHLFREL